MDIGILQSIWTVIAIIIFLAISLWALSGRRKDEFDQASRLPLDLEPSNSKTTADKSTKTQAGQQGEHHG